MTPLTREWVDKAESDFIAMDWLGKAPIPSYDAIGFHAQQCIEKYLKARLQEAGLPSPRTHDLEMLLDHCLALEPAWATMRLGVAFLSRFAVEVRYPGVIPTKADADEAMKICMDSRNMIRSGLGLPP